MSIFDRLREQPELDQRASEYVSDAAADAFMFGQTGSVAFLPAGWRGPKDERDLTLAATDEEYWAAMYPPELFNPKVAEAYLLPLSEAEMFTLAEAWPPLRWLTCGDRSGHMKSVVIADATSRRMDQSQ